jgi:hypothetical protein
MATTPSHNAGRQETCFYINRELPTSALGAGPRPDLNFAHLVRVRQQPRALTVVVVKPLRPVQGYAGTLDNHVQVLAQLPTPGSGKCIISFAAGSPLPP